MSYNLEQANSGFASYTAAGLAEGTNSGTIKTTNTLAFTSNGVFKSKGATDNLAVSAGTVIPASSAALFAVFINAAGTVSTVQGPIVAAGEPCPVPVANAAGLTPVGFFKVTTSSAATFTPGTTDLSASGITAAFSDCARLPGSAQ